MHVHVTIAMLEPEEVFAVWWLFADKRRKTKNRRVWMHLMLGTRLTMEAFYTLFNISEKTMENSSTISECHLRHLMKHKAS
jgi:hypothetical protein